MVKIKNTSSKFLVAFERQTMNSDAVVLLPASIESRKIIEAFVRWSEVGNKTWTFQMVQITYTEYRNGPRA